MIDGRADGWSCGVPVCALAGTVQQAEEHHINAPPPAASRASGREEITMKERDYISLGLTGAQEQAPLTSSTSTTGEEMECDNVVLSLGLGPPPPLEYPPSEQPTHAMVEQHQQQLRFKGTYVSASSQPFWHQNFRVSLSNDHHQPAGNRPHADASTQGSLSYGKGYMAGVPVWSAVPGRFVVPVPKVSTVPAKRTYQDVNRERRPVEMTPPNGLHPSSGGMYAWSTDNSFNTSSSASAGGWQQVHVNFEQTHFHNGTGFGHGSRQLAAPLPSMTTTFKVPPAAPNVSMPPPSTTNSMLSVPAHVKDAASQSEQAHESGQNKTAVVGWPPVRSYRKNTLQAAQTSNRMGAEDRSKSMAGGPSTSNSVDVLEHMNKNAFFVKARLDGVRICRKVDLKAYDSYEGLKAALQDMFHGFVSDNAKLDLLTGNNYVVTHEDKDGDCLLVGDVPWHMFLESSVKSVRIMKAADATGIGEKVSAKLKAEGSGKPS